MGTAFLYKIANFGRGLAANRYRVVSRALLVTLIGAFLVVSKAAASQPPQIGFHVTRGDALHLSAAKEGGASFVVLVFSWRDIEPVEGYLYWETADAALRAADFYDLEVVARLDQPPDWALADDVSLPWDVDAYASFTHRVAERYGDRLAGLIVWNEPNLALEWNEESPDPAGYVELLRAAYAASKLADPDLPVVLAGLAFTQGDGVTATNDLDYLRALYEDGASDWFDVVAAHAYGFGRPPEEAPADDRLNFRRLELHRAIMSQYGDDDKPVWITETGWRTTAPDDADVWQLVDASDQAAYTLRAVAYASNHWPWLQRMAFWELNSDADSYGYALWQGPDRVSEAYRALAARAALATDSAEGPQAMLAAPDAVEILAADVIVRLGDRGDLHPHWVHLRGDGEKRLVWPTEFYLSPQRSTASHDLLLETMQVDQPTNRLVLNGSELGYLAPRTRPDPTSTWVTQRFRVPAGMLQAGVNQLELYAGLRSPVRQYDWWRNENLQVRNVRLVPADQAERAPDESWREQADPGSWAEVHRLRLVEEGDDSALWVMANRRGQLWRVELSPDGTPVEVSDEGGSADLVFLDIAVHDGSIFVATDRGLYMRSDVAAWVPVQSTPSAQAHTLLVISDSEAGPRIYAGFEGRGVWRFDVDAGRWQPDGLVGQSVLDLSATEAGSLFAATNLGVFQRGSYGWRSLPTLPVPSGVKTGQSGDNFVTRLFAGEKQIVARHNDTLWLYGDDTGWKPYGPDVLKGRAFSVINCCGTGDTWIASNHRGLWHQAKHGEWLPVDGDVFADLELTGGVIVSETMYVAGNNGLYAVGLYPRTPFRTEGTWRHVIGFASTVTDLIIAPDATTWLAATPSGVWRSRDTGRTWSAISAPWIVWDLALGPDGRLYAARSDGIAFSDDWSTAQATWTETGGLDTVTFFDVSPHPARPELLWAGSWGNNIGVSENGGATMRPLHNGLETLSVLDILWHDTLGQVTVATIEGMYRTDDGGKSWFKLPGPLAEQTVYALHQTQDGSILAGTADGLWQSEDYGSSWTGVANLPAATVIRLGSVRAGGDVLLWAGTEGDGLWSSRDQGASWQRVGLDGTSVYALQSNADDELIVATDRGLVALRNTNHSQRSAGVEP